MPRVRFSSRTSYRALERRAVNDEHATLACGHGRSASTRHTCPGESPRATFHVDVDGAALLGALLQADVAAHVDGLSLGDAQRGRPRHPLLAPHLRPVLPLPLRLRVAVATQLEGRIERDDEVGAGGGDGGLGVACEVKSTACET